MKNILTLFFVLIMLAISVLSGCNSGNPNFSGRQGLGPAALQGGWQSNRTRGFNLTEEERQNMINQRQLLAVESCQGKNEGDNCHITDPGRNVSGVCSYRNSTLVCAPNRPMRQR